ncbi:MAG: caspase domain-containing protein [Cytophagales bacterium]|nr:caspase domain-containing protein [Cytophagales bacterium]
MKILLLIATFLIVSAASAQERRVALVIGNSAYRASPLPNPVNDAHAMAVTLRNLGFEVIEKQNLGREDFSKVVREYGDKLRGASVGLFYFAGHGLQVKGRNFLVPIDADIQREDEVPYRGFDVNEVLDKMDSARTAVNLVVLDACRNNPFATSFKVSSAGLAQIDAPAGTLIAFSTAPGSVAQDGEGSNGLYTGALLKHITQPNMAVEQMFKRVRVDVVAASKNQQVPWESSSLNRDFTFAKVTPALIQPAVNVTASTSAVSELSLELAFWDEVKRSSDPADFKAYLEQYPSGRFAPLARLRAASSALVAGATPTPARAPVATFDTKLSAKTPEGLYEVSVQGGAIQWRDVQKNAVIRNTAIFDGYAMRATQLQFSSDGRWLLIGLLQGSQQIFMLLDVASEKTVWQRQALSARFDESAPQVLLKSLQGTTVAVVLP